MEGRTGVVDVEDCGTRSAAERWRESGEDPPPEPESG